MIQQKRYKSNDKDRTEIPFGGTLLSDTAKQRYMKIHSQVSSLRLAESRHTTHYRRGKAYNNYLIRLPKRWADSLDLKAHDDFLWTVLSYDPVILQLRKLEENEINDYVPNITMEKGEESS